MGFDPASYAIGKKSSGGGGGGGTFSEEWDFTSATPLVGKNLGITMRQANRVTFSSNGAAFNQTSSFINFGTFECADLFHDIAYSSIMIETKIKSMELTSDNHRRFIMATTSNGLIYRSSGVWAFYSESWEDFAETDGALFDNSIVKVVIDSDYKWHIYKNGILLWEPTKAQKITTGYLGSSSNSINNAVIEWLKISAVME